MFGSLDGDLVLPLACRALEPQDQLLGGLCLLPQDGLGLTSETLLLTIVPVGEHKFEDSFVSLLLRIV